MTRLPSLLTVLTGAAALVAAGCGGPGAGTPAAVTVTVRGTEFKFDPETVRAAADKPVRVVLVGAGQLEHDLEIGEVPARNVRASAAEHAHGAKVAAHVQPGKRAWVEFTPTAKGTYEIVCTVPGHKDAGMRGSLVVE